MTTPSYGTPPPPPEHETDFQAAYMPQESNQKTRKTPVLVAGLVGLLVGAGAALGGVVLYDTFGDDSDPVADATEPAQTPSVPPQPEASSAGIDEGTREAAEEAPSISAAYEPAVEDFDVETSVKEQRCFGSAGCNVTLRTEPVYLGSDAPSGVWEVTYEITGIEDGPVIRTFDVDGEDVSFDDEAHVSVESEQFDIEIEITDVRQGFASR